MVLNKNGQPGLVLLLDLWQKKTQLTLSFAIYTFDNPFYTKLSENIMSFWLQLFN